MRALLFLITFFIHGWLCAQNLVVNGGFEQHARCPARFDQKPMRGVAGVEPIGGMPGYFHGCGNVMGTPSNWAGQQVPVAGEAYVGLVLTAHGGGECAVREFVQLQLAEPLVNGGKYRLTFYVSLADRSGYSTDRIGATFSKEDRSGKKGVASSFGRPDVDNPLNRFIADTAGWLKVEGIYNARGGEHFVQIGNFQLCDRTSRKAVTANKGAGMLHNMKRKGDADLDPDKERGLRRKLLATQAYVYLDEVTLEPLTSAMEARVFDPQRGCPPDHGEASSSAELIPDPSFNANVPAHRASWKNASGGTPDLLKGVTGIYLHSAVNKDHREYIQTPLTERLDPCGIYHVRLRIRRDASYGFAVDRIGVAITETFEMDRRRDLLSFPLHWETHGQGVFDETEQWTTLCGTFHGGGCANRLLIGNFASDDSTVIVQRDPEGGPFAYYFVDDVSLWRSGTVEGCKMNCPEAITAIPLEADTVNIPPPWPLILHFAVNDHVLGNDLLPTVEELFKVLAQNPMLRVRIEGHTDDSGNPYANMKLAERRALAVRDVLVRLGLPRKLFQIVVQGSAEPIATNSTEEGRAKNRRVEIELVGTE